VVEMRDLRPDDREKIRRWRNKPNVGLHQFTDHYIGVEEHERWFARVISDPTVRYWVITWNGKDVGIASLYHIDRRHQRCYWAFYIAEERFRGRGIGSLVEYFVLEHVFENLKLNKLCCEVLASNPAVTKMHQRFAFREEGYFRGHVIKNGQPADVHAMAILREEWAGRRPSIQKLLTEMKLLGPEPAQVAAPARGAA
jgi:UDP-4-amino-4,6-dideoxy-N-acetyl-beta-L-altrosamine N-acetyltransferase